MVQLTLSVNATENTQVHHRFHHRQYFPDNCYNWSVSIASLQHTRQFIGVFFMKIFFPKIQKSIFSQKLLPCVERPNISSDSSADTGKIVFHWGPKIKSYPSSKSYFIKKNDCDLSVVIRALDICFDRKKIRNFGP